MCGIIPTVTNCIDVHSCLSGPVENYLLQPLPSPCDAVYQECVTITRKQVSILDSQTKNSITVKEFITIMHTIYAQNGKDVLSFHRMDVYGGNIKYIGIILNARTNSYEPIATNGNQDYI